MKIVTDPLEMQKILLTLKPASIGFVPTMGALHEGHLELVRLCQEQNQITVVSIFVNPTQFNNAEDFNKYPKTIEQDQELLQKTGVNYQIGRAHV